MAVRGWLAKKSAHSVLGRHTWDERYFVLSKDRTVVNYYETDTNTREALGVIPVDRITSVQRLNKKGNTRFDINIDGSQPVQLRAKDGASAQEWVSALTAARAAVAKSGGYGAQDDENLDDLDEPHGEKMEGEDEINDEFQRSLRELNLAEASPSAANTTKQQDKSEAKSTSGGSPSAGVAAGAAVTATVAASAAAEDEAPPQSSNTLSRFRKAGHVSDEEEEDEYGRPVPKKKREDEEDDRKQSGRRTKPTKMAATIVKDPVSIDMERVEIQGQLVRRSAVAIRSVTAVSLLSDPSLDSVAAPLTNTLYYRLLPDMLAFYNTEKDPQPLGFVGVADIERVEEFTISDGDDAEDDIMGPPTQLRGFKLYLKQEREEWRMELPETSKQTANDWVSAISNVKSGKPKKAAAPAAAAVAVAGAGAAAATAATPSPMSQNARSTSSAKLQQQNGESKTKTQQNAKETPLVEEQEEERTKTREPTESEADLATAAAKKSGKKFLFKCCM